MMMRVMSILTSPSPLLPALSIHILLTVHLPSLSPTPSLSHYTIIINSIDIPLEVNVTNIKTINKSINNDTNPSNSRSATRGGDLNRNILNRMNVGQTLSRYLYQHEFCSAGFGHLGMRYIHAVNELTRVCTPKPLNLDALSPLSGQEESKSSGRGGQKLPEYITSKTLEMNRVGLNPSQLCENANVVCIIGHTGSGILTLSTQLASRIHSQLIIADNERKNQQEAQQSSKEVAMGSVFGNLVGGAAELNTANNSNSHEQQQFVAPAALCGALIFDYSLLSLGSDGKEVDPRDDASHIAISILNTTISIWKQYFDEWKYLFSDYEGSLATAIATLVITIIPYPDAYLPIDSYISIIASTR